LTSCGGDDTKEKEIAVSGVSVSPTTLSLSEGEKARLSANVTPADASDKTVSWTSSNESVASVGTGGEVTGVKAGNATITVTTKSGNKKATCAVTVNANKVAVESVSLSESELSLTEGETESLSATLKPENATDKSVEWSSSDDKIATVDQSGKVSAIKAGSATITVTTKDGAKKSTCKVTVNAKIIAVESVELNKTAATIKTGASETLIATVKPENANDKSVTWTTSDDKIATVDQSGKVSAIKAGSATITVTTKDGAKKSTCKVTVEDIALTGISLSPSASTMKIGQTVTLTVSYTPSDATNKEVTWNSGKPDVASVDQSGKVTAVAPGSSQIVATSKDGGLKAVCNVTVQNEALTGTIQVDGIYYKPVSAGSVDVMVTYKEGTQYAGNSYSGTVKVPATFDYEGVTYNVTQVGERAFSECHSLTSVSLPEGLTDIGELAFDSCENLETLSLPASLKFIYYDQAVFDDCEKLNVTVASGGIFKVTDGMLYGEYSNNNRLVLLQQNKTGEVSIPEGITMINLNAIRKTAITKITVPNSVVIIKSLNFCECPNLKDVVLNWNETQLASLLYSSFPSSSYFVKMVYSDITVSVPKGTKAAYAAHPLWGMGFKIVER